MQTQEATKTDKRISIEECRKALGQDGNSMSDKQIEDIRDALYVLGDSVLDNIFNSDSVGFVHD